MNFTKHVEHTLHITQHRDAYKQRMRQEMQPSWIEYSMQIASMKVWGEIPTQAKRIRANRWLGEHTNMTGKSVVCMHVYNCNGPFVYASIRLQAQGYNVYDDDQKSSIVTCISIHTGIHTFKVRAHICPFIYSCRSINWH